MKKYVLGIVTGLALAIVAVFVMGWGFLMYVEQGHVDPRADVPISSFEKNHAMGALDASLDRYAPKTKDPIQPTASNLSEGAKLYGTYCADCHGVMDKSETAWHVRLYPPAPQFPKEPTDMEEFENFYVIKHGVRWTGMPAWSGELRDDQIWTLVTYLNAMKEPSAAKPGMDRGAEPSLAGSAEKGAGN
jgi:mono/diheme cytochrome c family protein